MKQLKGVIVSEKFQAKLDESLKLNMVQYSPNLYVPGLKYIDSLHMVKNDILDMFCEMMSINN